MDDGYKSLKSESKVGVAVQWVVTVLGTGALSWLNGLDTSHWSGYLGMVGVALTGLGAGTLTAYLKRNKKES